MAKYQSLDRNLPLSLSSDSELQVIMSSLEITPGHETNSENGSSMQDIRRSLRIRPREEVAIHQTNRRVIARPKKRDTFPILVDDKAIKAYYMNSKKMKSLVPTNLETIFEEPKNNEGKGLSFMGLKKFRRSLKFCDGINTPKATVLQRKKRAQKINGRKRSIKKISIELFTQQLQAMENSNRMGKETDDNETASNTESTLQ